VNSILLVASGLLAILLSWWDWRSCSVPPVPFFFFCVSWIWRTWPEFQWGACGIGVLFILGVAGIEFILKRPLLGIADKILIPIILSNISLPSLGSYLVCVGSLGVLLSLIWNKIHQSAPFPFLPCLIFPAFIYACPATP
jgi:hypothetical protein